MPYAPSIMNPSSVTDFVTLIDEYLISQPIGQSEYTILVLFPCSEEVGSQIESAYSNSGWIEVSCDRYVNKTILYLKNPI